MGYRVSKTALDAEGREQARAEAALLRAQRDETEKALDFLRAQLLADPEYVALRTQLVQIKQQHDRAWGRSYHKRITVGIDGGMLFHVKAEGDNWQEVVAALCQTKVKGEAPC